MSYDNQAPELEELGYLLAEASRNVTFVIGAGLSMPVGLPGWVKLNEKLAAEAYSAIDHDGTINAAEKARRIEELKAITDPWVLGDALQRAIPRDRYVGTVRRLLTASAPPPATYDAIWRLNPSGVVNFNLDRLAEQALSGTPEQVATPVDESKYLRFLLLRRPFLFQPHGNLADPKTWVLGLAQRNRLLRDNRNYREWVGHLLSTHRLVIVGFGPKDFSFESLLLTDFRGQLRSRSVDHFWIVANPSAQDRQWAEDYHLRVIPYSPTDAHHSDVNAILVQCATYRPREPQPGVAYNGPSITVADLPPDDELRKQALPDIRARLNAALKGATEAIHDYDQQLEFMATLMRQFSASVHMAWHMKPGAYDSVWGYRIIEELGKGGFGYVWKVEDVVDGQVYAMKVLHESVIEQIGFLEAFRRGVRAMHILEEGKVPGMVRYRAAFDIPACVVMEHIDGVDFEKAIQALQLESLAEALDVVYMTGTIVLRGHSLGKQVLHRDLKPANVMLRNFYQVDAHKEVVVLDFDLSWYEGAMGRSMMQGTHLHNYVAPEQVTKRPGVSSRHTAVDVFGLGMLLYFACTGKHPPINVQLSKGFREATEDAIRARWPSELAALPTYLALVIEAAAADEQRARPAMSVTVQLIEAALEAARSQQLETPSDLANLELASALMASGWKGPIQLDGLRTIALTFRECTATLGFVDSDDGVVHRCILTYSHGGGVDWSRVKAYGKQKRDRALSILAKHRLFKSVKATGDEAMSIEVETEANGWNSKQVQRLATTIRDAANTLAFVDI